jgi:hypothetical protein
MESNYHNVGESIAKDKELSSENEEILKSAITEFKQSRTYTQEQED